MRAPDSVLRAWLMRRTELEEWLARRSPAPIELSLLPVRTYRQTFLPPVREDTETQYELREQRRKVFASEMWEDLVSGNDSEELLGSGENPGHGIRR
jgi:hypothetical protein